MRCSPNGQRDWPSIVAQQHITAVAQKSRQFDALPGNYEWRVRTPTLQVCGCGCLKSVFLIV